LNSRRKQGKTDVALGERLRDAHRRHAYAVVGNGDADGPVGKRTRVYRDMRRLRVLAYIGQKLSDYGQCGLGIGVWRRGLDVYAIAELPLDSGSIGERADGLFERDGFAGERVQVRGRLPELPDRELYELRRARKRVACRSGR
jgi:hypothetical protein